MPVDTSEPTEADLLAMAESYDNTGEFVEPEAAQPEGTREPSTTGAESTTAATQAGDEAQEPEVPSSDTFAEKAKEEEGSKYQKAQKEAARRDKSWQALEAEKAEFRQSQEAFKAEAAQLRQEIDATKRELAAVKQPAKAKIVTDEGGHTAQDWREFASSMVEQAAQAEESGDFTKAAQLRQNANVAKARAEKLGSQPAPATQPTAPAVDYTQEQWAAETETYAAQNPELRDPNSPLRKETEALLNAHPLFKRSAQGVAYAGEVAKLKLGAAKVPGLEQQVATLTAEIERLNKATAIGGSNPTRPAQAKDFDSMSPEEQDRELLRRARDADSQGIPLEF